MGLLIIRYALVDILCTNWTAVTGVPRQLSQSWNRAFNSTQLGNVRPCQMRMRTPM